MLALERFDDVTRLRFTSPITRALGYEVSAYVTRGVLIDTGFPLIARDLATWLDASRPQGVVLTHHHEDHAGNLELLARGGLPVAAADSTLRAVRALGALGLYRRVCWGSPPSFRTPISRFEADGLRLVPTPGHSTDHHVVWDAERETLFGGDLFLGVKVRVAQEMEAIPTLVKSLRTAIALAPKRFFCAHRGLVDQPLGALRAKADWLEEIKAETERLTREGCSDAVISRRLLGREGFTGFISRGKLSKTNLIRAMRRE
jgi:glyoxylase-like metal-dependent hydrolase (beta-lactamase superfamily II)